MGSKRSPMSALSAVQLTDKEYARVQAMASRSGITVAHWIRSAIVNACSVDEAHWEQMDATDALRKEMLKDKHRFARVSRMLTVLPEHTFAALTEEMLHERLLGRREGSESATRLAAVAANRKGE